MATAYNKDQPGAPSGPYSASPGHRNHFDALKAILKAALVYGYGVVPAAGWSLAYEASDTLILGTASGSGYVCFKMGIYSGYTHAEVWLASTFEGVDANGIILGAGRRSGVAANSAAPQRLILAMSSAYDSSTTWAVVADENSAIVVLSAATGPSPVEVASTSAGNQAYANYLFYFGDDSGGDLVCFGGSNTTSNGLPLFSSAGCTILKYPDTGLLVDSGGIAVGTYGLLRIAFHGNLGGAVFPEAQLQPVSWHANGVTRYLKGVAQDSRFSAAWASHVSQALGGPPLTTRTVSTVLTLGDGHQYVIGLGYSAQSMTLLLTTNPEFW